MVGRAMRRATEALLQGDLGLAGRVIVDAEEIATMSARAEEKAFVLLALQSPVAADLRTVVSSIQIAADVERMGALAAHIAKIARRRHPRRALPEVVAGHFAEVGRLASRWARGHSRCCCPGTHTGRHKSATTMTRWMICTALAARRTHGPSMAAWRGGRRGCHAVGLGSTSASLTTPSKSLVGSSSRQPVATTTHPRPSQGGRGDRHGRR